MSFWSGGPRFPLGGPWKSEFALSLWAFAKMHWFLWDSHRPPFILDSVVFLHFCQPGCLPATPHLLPVHPWVPGPAPSPPSCGQVRYCSPHRLSLFFHFLPHFMHFFQHFLWFTVILSTLLTTRLPSSLSPTLELTPAPSFSLSLTRLSLILFLWFSSLPPAKCLQHPVFPGGPPSKY